MKYIVVVAGKQLEVAVDREQVPVDATVRHFRQVEGDPGAGYLVGLNFVSPPLALLHSIEQLALHDHEAGGEHT